MRRWKDTTVGARAFARAIASRLRVKAEFVEGKWDGPIADPDPKRRGGQRGHCHESPPGKV
jgi:hypothetical protein